MRSNQERNAHSFHAIKSGRQRVLAPCDQLNLHNNRSKSGKQKLIPYDRHFLCHNHRFGSSVCPCDPACFHRASPVRYKRKLPSVLLPRDSSATIRVAPRDSSVRKGIVIQLAPRDSTADRQLLSTRGCRRPQPPPRRRRHPPGSCAVIIVAGGPRHHCPRL